MPSPIERAYWNAFTLVQARRETRLPYWPLEKILEIQNRRVRAMVKHAYDTVPFYRAAMEARRLTPGDFHSAADLSKLPLISSEQVARSPEEFRSRQFAEGSLLRLVSSGTQGFPKPVYYDHAALMLALAHGHRQRVVLARFVGKTLGYREMNIERLDGTGFKLRRFYETYSMIPRRLDYARAFVSPSQSVEDIVGAINRFAPEVIRGYGSHLGLVFRQAHAKHLRLCKPKAVVWGGDSMSEADARLIEHEFGVPVVSSYQAVEALRIAYQCEERAGFHINLDQVAVRVVDAQGASVSNGEAGRVVLSNLTNRATVLLNYLLGDIAALADQPCACGRSLPVLARIQGRANDCVILPDGRIIHSLVLMPPLQAVDGVVQLQIVQSEPAQFLMRVVCAEGADWEFTRGELERRARARLGSAAALDVARVEAIVPDAGGKVRAVISNCLNGTGAGEGGPSSAG
jgi:phenylacetate-CoA ligase